VQSPCEEVCVRVCVRACVRACAVARMQNTDMAATDAVKYALTHTHMLICTYIHTLGARER
jgi:hypothetical protein